MRLRAGGSKRTANLAPGEGYYISTDGGKNADSIFDKPRCSVVLITASSVARLKSTCRMKMFSVQNTQQFILMKYYVSDTIPQFST